VRKRLDKGPIKDIGTLQKQYDELFQNEDFMNACKAGTSQENNVRTRINIAIQYFQKVL
jgi:hypothetical protein